MVLWRDADMFSSLIFPVYTIFTEGTLSYRTVTLGPQSLLRFFLVVLRLFQMLFRISLKKIRSSCEFVDFVENHLCKMCAILR